MHMQLRKLGGKPLTNEEKLLKAVKKYFNEKEFGLVSLLMEAVDEEDGEVEPYWHLGDGNTARNARLEYLAMQGVLILREDEDSYGERSLYYTLNWEGAK